MDAITFIMDAARLSFAAVEGKQNMHDERRRKIKRNKSQANRKITATRVRKQMETKAGVKNNE